MPANLIEPSLFYEYAMKLKSELEHIETFLLPEGKFWKIDWAAIQNLIQQAGAKNWNAIPIYPELLSFKNNPSVYYFTVNKLEAKQVFNCFNESKQISTLLRRNKGVTAEGFYNISHVPINYSASSCIYVGSRRSNLYERFKQHLGFCSGRTVALYLSKVLETEIIKPEIHFHYHILDKKFQSLTLHIENALRNELKPFIGKA